MGLQFGNGYFEILSLTVLLGFSSMCLGLLVSSVLSSTEQAMPILVGLTMTEVVLSGALPGKNEGFIALISPLVPSYWSMNSLAATADLVKISTISDPDLMERWKPTLETMSQGALTVTGMSIVFLVSCFMVLVKKG